MNALPINPEASPKPALLDLTLEELASWIKDNDEQPFRAKQIWRWLYHKRAKSFEDMSDLSKSLRTKLDASFRLFPGEVVKHQIAKDRTEKILIRLNDGEHVECVLMRETSRNTVCISTQVGCAMGCVFCASGMQGLKRNLSTAEILQQLLLADRLQDADEKITNIVVMGIGEPLANLQGLLPALKAVQSEESLGLGARRITISTVGLPKKIRELADLGIQYNLAISLHAPNNPLRTQIVPTNKNIGIDEILSAADEFFDKTGRRVTFEYVMLSGVNDSAEHARQLARLLKGRTAHVNLIPMNSVEPLEFSEPSQVAKDTFVAILEQAGVPATIRKRKGEDIDAACGQLRLKQNNDLVTLG